ncbi:MAG: glycosyltransferase [Brumimicrobium sp.]|nr:glycosyltransferase [Brumimicrobium sp.]
MSDTAIIIPCYNEAHRLKSSNFLDFLSEYKGFSLYFIDDGSTDSTLSLLKDLKSKNEDKITVYRIEKNGGKGEAVRTGMMLAYETGQYAQIGFLDADLSTPLSEFVSLTSFLIQTHKKAVFGSRLKIGGTRIDRSPFRHIVGRFFATLISWTIKIPFYDTQCGAKVFESITAAKVCQKPFVSRWLFDVEIILRLKKIWGEAIFKYLHEFPLGEWTQVDGSKISFLDGVKVPFELRKIRKNENNPEI